MKQNIIEGNKLIALFMGATTFEHRKYGTIYTIPGFLCSHAVRELKYDMSWDWLMPVVEKICSISGDQYAIHIDVHDNFLHTPIHKATNFRMKQHGTAIQCVYLAVIECITYYNSQK